MKPKSQTETTGSAVEALLPTADMLASLAAQPRFEKLAGKQAALAALELWRESQAALARAQRQADLCGQHYAPLAHLRQPKTWPASFADFLKYVVQGKDTGEQLARFREFLRMKISASPQFFGVKGDVTEAVLLDALPKVLASFQGSYSQAAWQTLVLEFKRFWKRHKAEGKSRAGKKGAAVKLAKRALEK